VLDEQVPGRRGPDPAGAALDQAHVEIDSVAADALGASRVGDVPFAVLRAHLLVPLLVTDRAILTAQARLWEEFRIAAEPSAAAPFAAWLAGRVPGARPCVVISGSNRDWTPAG